MFTAIDYRNGVGYAHPSFKSLFAVVRSEMRNGAFTTPDGDALVVIYKGDALSSPKGCNRLYTLCLVGGDVNFVDALDAIVNRIPEENEGWLAASKLENLMYEFVCEMCEMKGITTRNERLDAFSGFTVEEMCELHINMC